MASLGLTGIAIDERHGGQGASAVTTGIAAEEVAAADFNAAYLLLIPLLAAEVVGAAGSDAQRAALLPADRRRLGPAVLLSHRARARLRRGAPAHARGARRRGLAAHG